MTVYSGGFRTAGAGSTTLPMASLYSGGATNLPRVREVGCFLSGAATGFTVALRKLTTLGGTHTARDELVNDASIGTSGAALFDTDTGTAPTITAGNIRTGECGDAKGSGPIWVFGGNGLVIPEGTANGIGIIAIAGTPQICTVYFVWEE